MDLILWLGVWALMVSWAWQLTEGVWARIYSAVGCSDAIRPIAVFCRTLLVYIRGLLLTAKHTVCKAFALAEQDHHAGTLHQPTFKKRYPYGLHFAKTEA